MLLTYIREEELYNLGGKDRGRILLWMENVSTFDLPCPGMRYVLMLQPRLPPWYCGRSQPLYVRALHPHLFWWHAQERATVSPPGDFCFPPEVLMCCCLQRWPAGVFLPSLSFLPPLAEREVCELILFHARTFSFEFFFFKLCLLKHWIFRMRHLNHTSMEPFKNRDVKPFGVIFLAGGPWSTEEFLTSTNKPFSLNSTLWINLFYLMVHVACATQTLVRRGYDSSPGPGRHSLAKLEKMKHFQGLISLSGCFKCWLYVLGL